MLEKESKAFGCDCVPQRPAGGCVSGLDGEKGIGQAMRCGNDVCGLLAEAGGKLLCGCSREADVGELGKQLEVCKIGVTSR
jgi:hypothetical protein